MCDYIISIVMSESLSPLLKQIYILKILQIKNNMNISNVLHKLIHDLYLTVNNITNNIQYSFVNEKNIDIDFNVFLKMKEVFKEIVEENNMENKLTKLNETENKSIMLIFLLEDTTKKIIGLTKIITLHNELITLNKETDLLCDDSNKLCYLSVEEIKNLEITIENQENILNNLLGMLYKYLELSDEIDGENIFINDNNCKYVTLLKNISKNIIKYTK